MDIKQIKAFTASDASTINTSARYRCPNQRDRSRPLKQYVSPSSVDYVETSMIHIALRYN